MIIQELEDARKATGLTQAALAERAGVTRMTVQRIEGGQIDPRLSTLQEMARALGLELMTVPSALRPQLENFVRSGGRLLGQPAGIGAPPSIAQSLADK
jgi:transcriptional regulator with XRE-family HTH domain